MDDSSPWAQDHALLVNRAAAFFFNTGHFCLLLSTTVFGSGLNLLAHSYLAATAALPDNAKNLVCGGFAAILLSISFIKSIHRRRIPTNPRHQAIFVAAYVIQTIVTLAVVAVSSAMCLGHAGGYLESLMQNDIELLFVLSGFALFLVGMGWLDEAVELNLYESGEDSREFMVHPFGFWWCLKPIVTEEEIQQDADQSGNSVGMSKRDSFRLSMLSPLLGSSAADMKLSFRGYDSVTSVEDESGEYHGGDNRDAAAVSGDNRAEV